MPTVPAAVTSAVGRTTLARSVSWREAAACTGAELELFFPLDDRRDGTTVARALSICHRCPVRQQCLDWSVAIAEPYGIFGGMTATERRALRHRWPRRPSA